MLHVLHALFDTLPPPPALFTLYIYSCFHTNVFLPCTQRVAACVHFVYVQEADAR